MSSNQPSSNAPLSLPPLPYEYNALEPIISEDIMKVHHLSHHQTYTDNTNKALIDLRGRGDKAADHDIDYLIIHLNSLQIPEDIKKILRNHGGGYVNHALFWKVMSPPSLKSSSDRSHPSPDSYEVRDPPAGDFLTALLTAFKSIDEFRAQFEKAALAVFGSGWAWLVVDGKSKALRIETTSNQDNPSSGGKGDICVLGLDVWEHAYYLQYKSKRAEYVKQWWKVVNWDFVQNKYKEAISAIGSHKL